MVLKLNNHYFNTLHYSVGWS